MQHNLNENIKKYRKEMNLTQADLAEAFGITEGAVSKWESGNTVPDISILMDLADFFDISVDTLLGYSISSKSIDSITDRMKKYLDEGKYDDAIDSELYDSVFINNTACTVISEVNIMNICICT